MDNIKISITENGTTTLATAGKYCDRNIEVEAKVINENDIVFNITGNCNSRFTAGGWDWVIEQHSDRIVCENVESSSSMFSSTKVSKIPFTIKYANTGSSHLATNMFSNAQNLTEIPVLLNLRPFDVSKMFYHCDDVRYIPEEVYSTWDWRRMDGYSGGKKSEVFSNCVSLRQLPMGILEHGYPTDRGSSSWFEKMAEYCYVLDEIADLPIANTGPITSGTFSNTVYACGRLKRFTFKTPNNQPYVVQWKNQTIDLSQNVGWNGNTNQITTGNTGITLAKQVKGDTSYSELKNDPDWFTIDASYSRYNHDSAVETINSLPDASAYIAENGGTNTVKFRGAVGAKTDGGAINTLTEEEIAVAAAKGWTVSLV